MDDNQQFGMTEQEVKNNNRAVIFAKIKYYFEMAEPTIVKILNATIYYSLRFIKNLVTAIVHMAMGKDV